MFRICEFTLPLLRHPGSRHPLYHHQLAMWEGWEQHSAMLLAAKTGTGKTRAAMLPVLKRREGAVTVYPTNKLLRDQVRAVAKFATEEGIEPLVWVPEMWLATDRAELYSRADHILIPVDGNLLDQWQEVMRCKNRGETLRRLLDPDKPKIIFTNPDILFLILGLQYHADPFEALRRYETLILDEFHLYQGVELAHALAMVALARGFGIFRRLVLLSATPHPDVRALLDRAVSPTVIDSHVEIHSASGRSRTAVHAVEVEPIQLTGADPIEILVSRIGGLKSELEKLRSEIPDADYLPAVVIVNSVLNAIRLEDRLVESGFTRNSLAIIRGLSHRAIRDTRGKLLALGTSAIEVGVDFRCDYLLFEASEAASFLSAVRPCGSSWSREGDCSGAAQRLSGDEHHAGRDRSSHFRGAHLCLVPFGKCISMVRHNRKWHDNCQSPGRESDCNGAKRSKREGGSYYQAARENRCDPGRPCGTPRMPG